MRFRSWLSAVVLAVGVVAVSPSAPAASAQLDRAPSVTARPSTGLSASSVVRVTATGLPKRTEVSIVQCDKETYDYDGSRLGCAVVHTTTTSRLGRISEQVSASTRVYRSRPYGDDEPVYCRADICRFFVEWVVDDDWQSVATAPLEFTGDPATITATPHSGLVDGQLVEVTGTAKGSPSRHVTIIQTACYDIIQDSGCYGDTPLATVPLTEDDTFTASVNVQYWPNCAPDDYMTTCELHVVVYDAQGKPDGSFGSGWSGPHSAYLGFAPVA